MPIILAKQLLLNLPRTYKRGLVIFFDSFACIFSVWFSFGLRLDQWGWIQGWQWAPYAFSLTISLPIFISFGLYRAIYRYVGSVALLSMVRAFAIYFGLFLFVFTFIGVNDVPRSIGVIQPIFLFVVIAASRFVVRYWLADENNHRNILKKNQPTALIYGAGSAGRQLAAGLIASRNMSIGLFIDDSSQLHGSTINGIPVYPSENIRGLIEKFTVTDVLLAIPSAKQSRRSEIIASLYGCGVRVRTLPGLSSMAAGQVTYADLHDLDMNDLLGRSAVSPMKHLLEKNIKNQIVLITGAGGSIGGELCRQVIRQSPKSLILVDSSEHALYLIYEELKQLLEQNNEYSKMLNANMVAPSFENIHINLVPCLASVRDKDVIHQIFNEFKPATVFHAAAYKHVPLVEQNPAEGIRNNVFGTLTCAMTSMQSGVRNFILVSTDKAVRPTNIMGASKRIAELILQGMADNSIKNNCRTTFSMVRFGNVLGSSGSVAPLFRAQINAGGPITLTHLDVTRYFMTIPEAAQLVIQASAMATGGDVFVLDMGDPVRIYDLAKKMIYLSGLSVKDKDCPSGDIEIKITGLRPGEKLYEELLIGADPQVTSHPKILKAHEDYLVWDDLELELNQLKVALDSNNLIVIRNLVEKLVPGYRRSNVD